VQKAVDKAYHAIRKAVLDGEFSSGDRLKESVLAATIGVSRTPVREALRRLSAEGLIDFSSSHRAAVAQWGDENISELFRLRSTLESYAASLAAANISTEKTEELILLQDRMESAAQARNRIQFKAISLLNNQFHKIILDASGNKRLVTLMSGLIEMAVILQTYRGYSEADLARSFGHHREMIAAFEARDSEWAGSVMKSHILAARASYLRRQDRTPEAGKVSVGQT